MGSTRTVVDKMLAATPVTPDSHIPVFSDQDCFSTWRRVIERFIIIPITSFR